MYIITLPQNHLNRILQSHTMDDLLDDAGLTHLHIKEYKYNLLFTKFTQSVHLDHAGTSFRLT